MKKFLFALLLIFWPTLAFGAINVAANWELRGNGSDLNAGGFTLGISSKSSKTDLVVDATTNTIVTSAGYVFSSADVNRWIQVTAGTGWTPGYYQILSVSGTKATLNHSPAALGTTAGSFSIYWGLDYSQQNAKNANGGSNGSSVLAAAAGTTTITCSDCSFTNDIVGNLAYFSGGTGSITAQRRSITGFTSSTQITIDTAIASSTGMTLNIGGALASMDEMLGTRGIVAGNVVWWKNDTGITTGNALTSSVGARLNGYNSTRGDLDAAIGSSSRPTLTFTGTSAFALTFTSGSWVLRDFIVNVSSGTGTSGVSVAGGENYLYNLTVKNYDSIGITLSGTAAFCYACEVTGGTVNATKGINVANGEEVWDSYVHDGNGVGIAATSFAEIIGNLVSNQAGATSDGIQFTTTANAPPIILNNTVYNSGRSGINFTTSVSTTLPHVLGNVLVNNAAFGISFPAAKPAGPFNDGNAFYNNTSGARNDMDALGQTDGNPIYARVNDINLSGNPFVSSGTGNFALNATAGAGGALRNAGLPRAWPGSITAGYADVGAVFHQDPGTVTVNANCAF